MLSLSADLSNLIGSYTPTNYQQLENGDIDLGSSSPAILPAQPSSQTPWMLVEGGKDAILKLLNRAALPGLGSELQLIDLPQGLFSAPAIWSDASNQRLDLPRLPRRRHGLSLGDQRRVISQLVGIWHTSRGNSDGEGRSPVVADGMVFVAFDSAIVALNALNGKELWSSAKLRGDDRSDSLGEPDRRERLGLLLGSER